MKKKDYKDYFKICNFNIELNRDIVLHMIDCHENSPIFAEVNTEYDILEAEVYCLVEPVALIKFGNNKRIVEREKFSDVISVIYVLITIGDSISKLSSKCFEVGDYLAGMILNAMADQYMFQMEASVEKFIREECAIRHLGVKQRLEAPSLIPMETNKIILKETKADMELNMCVTEGYMFSIVKTNAYMLLLTKDDKCFNIRHNCEQCEAHNCKMRYQNKVNLKIIRG